jgi:hypothetical protein
MQLISLVNGVKSYKVWDGEPEENTRLDRSRCKKVKFSLCLTNAMKGYGGLNV